MYCGKEKGLILEQIRKLAGLARARVKKQRWWNYGIIRENSTSITVEANGRCWMNVVLMWIIHYFPVGATL
jgi:coproporphyrinogen III oxidase-like Fe-S oxidoreductase